MPSPFTASFLDGDEIIVGGATFEYVQASNLLKKLAPAGSGGNISFSISAPSEASLGASIQVERTSGFFDFTSADVTISGAVESVQATIAVVDSDTLSLTVPQSLNETTAATLEVSVFFPGGSASATTLIDIVLIPPLTSAFLAATGISDNTIASALQNMEQSLGAANILSKYYALYPFVGASENAHKYNFIDAQDLDAAYRLSFSGTITHSVSGWVRGGTISFANTHFNVLSNVDAQDFGMIYSQDSDASDGTACYIGASTSNTNNYTVLAAFNSGNTVVAMVGGLSGSEFQDLPSNRTTGLIQSNAISGRAVSLYVDGVQRSNTVTNTGALTNQPIYIGMLNSGGTAVFGTTRTIQIAGIRQSLTATELADEASIINQFLSDLGRIP